jgi:hypothetical protein
LDFNHILNVKINFKTNYSEQAKILSFQGVYLTIEPTVCDCYRAEGNYVPEVFLLGAQTLRIKNTEFNAK